MSVRFTKLFLALCALAAGACDGLGAGIAPGPPRLGVMLSDAPADLAEANVRIQKVVLIREDSGG